LENDSKQKIEVTNGYGWPSIIYEVKMPNYNDIKNEIVNFIQNVKVKKPIHHSDDAPGGIGPHEQAHKKFLEESYPTLFENEENKHFNDVKNFCLDATLSIAIQNNIRYADTSHWIIAALESWYHITKDKGFHDIHTHPNSAWCGIFYADIGDASIKTQNGINRFYSSNSGVLPIVGNEYLSCTSLDAEPEDGKLLIFPGSVPHSALPYYGKKDRIVISFNSEIVDSRTFKENIN
jgi:uncharacterized protein (TIGR02466 family)